MVKEPRPGRVKTRLGAGIGMGAAARWFRRQSGALIRRLSADPRWETILAVAPDRAGLESRVWPSGPLRWPQGGGDLGSRMGRIFRSMPPGPVLIIGADIPGISRDDIAAAFRALGSADAVFGPADDGGYWLVGLSRTRRAAPSSLFKGVRWSTEHALADTERSLGDARIAHLRTLRDIDTAADLALIDRSD
ncbi:MAG: TIGR04282 family arsenosugar biosynthesis glycosyltransferase [Pseudomonadota bacterium]